MGVAVSKIDIQGEGAATVPSGGNSARPLPVCQGARIGGAGDPGIIRLILHRKCGVRGDALRVVGDGNPSVP